MKKLATSLSAAALLFSSVSFALDSDNTSVNSKTRTSFQKDFSNAENASWNKKNDVYFVSFDVNKAQAEAAYSEQGELLGFSRQVTATEMPLSVSLAIAKKYIGYEVAKAATEINYESQTNYYINVANANETLKLKCAVNGDISVDKKTKK
jgi:hypothetical protein